MSDLRWLDFIQGNNTLMVTNEREFNKFRDFMDDIGLGKFLRDEREFSDWQHLSILNNSDPKCIIFEIQPGKGMSFGYTPESSKEWYGVEPLKLDALDSFYEQSKLFKPIEKTNSNQYIDATDNEIYSEKELREMLFDEELEDLYSNLESYKNGELDLKSQLDFVRNSIYGDINNVIDNLNSSWGYKVSSYELESEVEL